MSEHPSHPDSAPADSASSTTPNEQVALFTDELFWFIVRFHADLDRDQRAEFFERLAVYLCSHGMVMAELHGVCVLLAVERPLVPADRHVAINWLIDEALVGAVHLGPICSASDVYEGRLAGGNWYRKSQSKTGSETPEDAERFSRQRNLALHLILIGLLDQARLEYVGVLLEQSRLA